jgi:biopolymer transport protein ExbD
MAISVNGGGGGGRGFGSRRRASTGTLSEINVTPFVDVVLVLLIIFMLTAHVMEFGIEVDVPQVNTTRDSQQELPVVIITKDGSLYLNEKATNINDLESAIHTRFPNAKAVYLRADKDTIWEPIAQVTAMLGDAKLQVNIVTQPTDTAAQGKRR